MSIATGSSCLSFRIKGNGLYERFFSFLHFLALAALAAFFRFWPILAFWPWILEDKQAQSPVIIECVLSRPVHSIFKADSYGKICDEISSPQLLSPACVKC